MCGCSCKTGLCVSKVPDCDCDYYWDHKLPHGGIGSGSAAKLLRPSWAACLQCYDTISDLDFSSYCTSWSRTAEKLVQRKINEMNQSNQYNRSNCLHFTVSLKQTSSEPNAKLVSNLILNWLSRSRTTSCMPSLQLLTLMVDHIVNNIGRCHHYQLLKKSSSAGNHFQLFNQK